jgi:hypothetical protein
MTTSDHRHNEINNAHDNHSQDDEIDSGKNNFIHIFFYLSYLN